MDVAVKAMQSVDPGENASDSLKEHYRVSYLFNTDLDLSYMDCGTSLWSLFWASHSLQISNVTSERNGNNNGSPSQ